LWREGKYDGARERERKEMERVERERMIERETYKER
jgi:hypothetical protein